MKYPVILGLLASLCNMTWLAMPAQAQLSAYSQDFESMSSGDPDALGADGWVVYGNVFDSGGAYLFGYGVFPAPNGPFGFSAINDGSSSTGPQGGPNQGTRQLVVYSDYQCCQPANGHFNGTDRVESNVFQEQTIDAADVGSTWTFSFHAKRDGLAGIQGTTTAMAFIKTLDPNAGYATTNLVSIDMTNISDLWQEDNRISLTIDAGLVGQLLQFGFASTASNFELSAILYDNVVFERNCGNSIVDEGESCDDGNAADGDGCSALCAVEAGFVCTTPAAPNVVADPSFETGTPNSFWTEASTNFGTPLCTTTSCGGAGGGTGPSDGEWWSWFGGVSGASETGSVDQLVTIPPGFDTLQFDLEIPVADTTGVLNVSIADPRCFNGGLCLLATFSQADGPFVGYRLESRNISGYADGTPRTLIFDSTTDAGAGALNFFVDNVRIIDRNAAPSQCAMQVCSTPGLALPDGDPAGVSDSLSVNDAGILSDLDVSIATTHTWVGDLVYTLEHVETATSVVLIDRPGLPLIDPTFGCQEDNIDVVLDDAAPTAAEDQCDPVSPAIGGSQTPNNLLSAFNGQPFDGTWTMTVSDNATGDTGTFDQWCLIPTFSPVSDTDGDGVNDDVDNCTNVMNPDQADINGDLIGDRCDADVAGQPDIFGTVGYAGVVTAATGAFAALTPDGTEAGGPVVYDADAVAAGLVDSPAQIVSIDLNVGGFCFSTGPDSSGCPLGGAYVPITSIDSADVTFAGGLPVGGTSAITAFSPTFGVFIPITIDHDNGTVFADGGALGTVSGTFTPDGMEDCFVNFADLQKVKDAFFSNPALPAWDPEVDFDGSGLINFSDLQVVKDQIFGPPGPSAAGCN